MRSQEITLVCISFSFETLFIGLFSSIVEAIEKAVDDVAKFDAGM